jgi:WD40 repeat protein
LSQHEEIRVIVETDSVELQQIPWQTWDLFADRYPNSEIVLSPPEYELPYKKSSTRKKSKVRILAVLGDSQGINTKFDRDELEKHSRWADIEFLDEKLTKKKLLEKIVETPGWDILFFAGHSDTDDKGKIAWFAINKQERLTIGELKNSLREAIANGLHLAIFNSCKGLGLANDFAKLHLPQSIVMREPIPDEVAQEFLQHFLSAFAGNNSFYMSVRMARNQLEDSYNNQYPGVSWLPTICQNPAAETIKMPDIWLLKYTLTGHSDFIKTVAIDSDKKILASGGPDKIVKLWNLETGQWIRDLTEHSSAIISLAFSHDGKTLASASNMEFMDGTIKLWDTDDWTLKQTLGKSLIALRTSAIAFSLDDKSLATSHLGATMPFDAGINIWHLDTDKKVRTLRGHGWEAWSIAFTPDGQFLVSGGPDGSIKIWNWRNGELWKTFNRPDPSDLVGSLVAWFDSSVGLIWSIDISPDGQIVASGDSNGRINLWNVKEEKLIRTLTEHQSSVSGLAFSPDGEVLASAGSDNTVKIWNPATGELLDTLEHKNRVHCVAFSSDGKILVTGSSDQTIKVWERLGL